MHPHRPARGVALLLAALVLFVMLDATSKHLGQRYPVPLLVWARYTTHFLLMLALLAPRFGRRLIRSAHPGRQTLRATMLLGTTFFSMAALQRMPLAETTAVVFAAPLIVTLLAGPMLGETFGRLRWAAVLVGFCGVLLIARPGGDMNTGGLLLALAAANCYAIYQLMTRQLSGSEHPVTLLFYTALVGTLAMTPVLPWFWQGPRPDWIDMLKILSMGIYGGAGHFLLIRAFREAPASLLSPVTYAQLAWATLFGWVIFEHLPAPTALAGIAIIGGAGVMLALDGRRPAFRRSSSEAAAGGSPR